MKVLISLGKTGIWVTTSLIQFLIFLLGHLVRRRAIHRIYSVSSPEQPFVTYIFLHINVFHLWWHHLWSVFSSDYDITESWVAFPLFLHPISLEDTRPQCALAERPALLELRWNTMGTGRWENLGIPTPNNTLFSTAQCSCLQNTIGR